MDDKTLALLGDREAAHRLTERMDLLPCVCGGEMYETGAICNYAKSTITLNLKCKKCGTTVRFKTKWLKNPIRDAFLGWNTRAPVLTPAQLALLRIGAEPRKFEEDKE